MYKTTTSTYNKTRSKLDHKAWRNWFYNSTIELLENKKCVTFLYYLNSTQVVYRGVAADAPRLKTADVKIRNVNQLATLRRGTFRICKRSNGLCLISSWKWGVLISFISYLILIHCLSSLLPH